MRFLRTNPAKALFAFLAVIILEESTINMEATMGKPTLEALLLAIFCLEPRLAAAWFFRWFLFLWSG